MSTLEQWKPVNWYEGIYEVSNHGRVRSVDRTGNYSSGQVRRYKGKVRRTPLNQDGYPRVNLSHQGKDKTRTVHSLVVEAFIGACPEGMEVCHNDGDPTNNHIDNLRYGTPSDNTLDRVKHGRDHNAAKTHCPLGHELFAENIRQSQSRLGWRQCLACNRARAYVYRYPELKPQLEALADSYFNAILNNRKNAA